MGMRDILMPTTDLAEWMSQGTEVVVHCCEQRLRDAFRVRGLPRFGFIGVFEPDAGDSCGFLR